MASAPHLEELLTCPICQDIYDDPMVLKCHHSLCARCLEQLKRVSSIWWKVDCPVCRKTTKNEEIQRDFRTVSLLEAHKSSTKNKPVTSMTVPKTITSDNRDTVKVKMCELCNKEPVRSRCKQCNRIICAVCSDTHKSIPSCKNHTLHSLDNLVAQEKTKLSQTGNSLRQLESKVAGKCHELQLYQHNMDELENQTLDVIAQWFEDTVRVIAQHKDMLNARVNQAISADKGDVQKVQTKLSDIQNEVRTSIENINAMLQESDPAKLLASTDTIIKTVKSGVLKTDTSKFTTPRLIDMTISQGKKWDSSTGIDVYIKRCGNVKQVVSWTPFKSNFESRQYNLHNEIVTEAGAKQILFVAGYLWCLYHNRIDIHNKEGTWIDSVTDHLDNPNGISPMVGNYILVACMGSGLVQFNTGGKFLCTISEGSFCDVSADTQYVYGLDYSKNVPFIKLFQKGLFKWNLVRDIELPFDNCNPCNTLLCNGSHIFISVATHSCIYRYHSSGVMLEKYEWPAAQGSSQEHRPPRLCCADPQGQVVVAHFLQNSIWVLNPQRVWKEINVNGVVNPYGVAIDDDGAIWLVNLSNKLIKYT